jgi:flagella basal body P-ring formation protein FlgA
MSPRILTRLAIRALGGALLALALAPAAWAALPGSGVPEARVRAALVRAVAERGPWEADRVVVSEVSLPTGFAPAPDAALTVALPARDRVPGRVPFRVTVAAGGARESVWASARVEVMVPALVATRSIGRHQVLDRGVVRVADVPLSRLPGGAVIRPDQVVGQRTVRRIPQGRPVTRNMVEEPPVVTRGDRVTLIVRRPGLVVTAVGEAREDGAPDGMIQVLNLRSRRTVQGRVVDANTVEVAY